MKSTHPQTIQEYSNLVGIEYSKMNCWDIAVKFYKQVLGVELGSIYSGPTPPRDVTKDLIYTNIGGFEKVETPEFGDIIILKIFGIESHIAIYVGEGKMLHSSKNTGSVIDFVSRWQRVIVGFYRIKRAA